MALRGKVELIFGFSRETRQPEHRNLLLRLQNIEVQPLHQRKAAGVFHVKDQLPQQRLLDFLRMIDFEDEHEGQDK